MELTPVPTYEVDRRVLAAMFLIGLFSMVRFLSSFINAPECGDVEIIPAAANYSEGSVISFRAETKAGPFFQWDFGDNSHPDMSGSTVTHIFKDAGKYTVAVRVNGICEGVINVNISKLTMLNNVSLQPLFIVPDSAKINQLVTFSDVTNDVVSRRWKIIDDDGIEWEDTARVISHIFKTRGLKTIMLMVNGRQDQQALKMMYVKGTPLIDPKIAPVRVPVNKQVLPPIPENPPATRDTQTLVVPDKPVKTAPPVKIAEIKPDAMIALLEGLVTGSKKDEDITQFFFDPDNIIVRYNEESMRFSDMSKRLKAYKKLQRISIKQVSMAVDLNTNKIRSMQVESKIQRRFLK